MFWLLLAVILVLLTFVYGGFLGAPWVPSRGRDLRRFVNLAACRPGEIFYDLGCGDGRFVATAARLGADARGFEVSLLPYLLAKIRGLWLLKKAYHVRCKNFWPVSLSDADIIYIFLSPRANERLAKKLANELKPGARIIAYVWPIPGWTPEKIDEVPHQPKLFLYRR